MFRSFPSVGSGTPPRTGFPKSPWRRSEPCSSSDPCAQCRDDRSGRSCGQESFIAPITSNDTYESVARRRFMFVMEWAGRNAEYGMTRALPALGRVPAGPCLRTSPGQAEWYNGLRKIASTSRAVRRPIASPALPAISTSPSECPSRKTVRSFRPYQSSSRRPVESEKLPAFGRARSRAFAASPLTRSASHRSGLSSGVSVPAIRIFCPRDQKVSPPTTQSLLFDPF